MIAYFLNGLGLGFAAAAQPGPFQAYLISQSLTHGWKKTALAAVAPLFSDGPIVLLVLLILRQIPGWLQRFLYLAGGLFVLFLAWVAYDQWRKFQLTESYIQSSRSQTLFRAAVTNLLSPGPYLFWSLVNGPILVTGWRSSPTHGIAFLFAFYATMICVNLIIILTVGQASRFGNRLRRAMVGASALALSIFGFWQLWRAFASI